MADLGQTFDSSTVEPRASFDPLPAGEYNLQIIDSDIKSTKSGTGRYAELTMEVMDGEYANRRIWDRLNLWNDNKTAADIAHQTLSSICRATGVAVVSDTEQLHWQPMSATVRKVKRKNSEEWENRITYNPRSDAPAAAPAPRAAASAPAAAAAPAKAGGKPWERKRA